MNAAHRSAWRRRVRPSRPGAPLALLGCLAIAGEADLAAAQGAETSPWLVYVAALGAGPTSPQIFTDDWKFGFGLEGGLRRRFGGRFEVGLEGQFVQFGLADLPGIDSNGGARRVGRVVVPLHWRVVQGSGIGQDRFSIQVDGGYTHQSIEPITNVIDPPATGKDDGYTASAGVVYSRILYQQTRFVLGVRHTWLVLRDDTPGYLSFQLGAQMPLVGGHH